MKSIKEAVDRLNTQKSIPTVSSVFNDGSILELVFNPEERRTRFVLWKDGGWNFHDSITVDALCRLTPYSAHNNLIKNEVVLFPSQPEEYDSDEALLLEIQLFIHRYVQVSPFFEKLASYYVLFSWIYDGFNELLYLRGRGDPGCGKTRLLLTVGSLCYKPIFASGASTVSPIFRILDIFKGTLIVDESDFRMSDEKAELTKILNNGNSKGFPVLRCEVSSKGEFNPQAFHVFGPKIVATRGFFQDRALESRFLTEEMGQTRLRDDVPINLPASHKTEALHLRNKLLLFRFRNLHKRVASADLVDRTIEPRLNQIIVPLLSIIEDPKARDDLQAVMRQRNQDLISERGFDTEAQILEVIQSLLAAPETAKLTIGEITDRFAELYADEHERKVTNHWIGHIVRKRLGLKTQKSHGVFVIPPEEISKLTRLYERYGIDASAATSPGVNETASPVDMGDFGDFEDDAH